ncbi:MAG: hypothetical protein ACE5GT_06410 [Rhodospirillales bacterium]
MRIRQLFTAAASAAILGLAAAGSPAIANDNDGQSERSFYDVQTGETVTLAEAPTGSSIEVAPLPEHVQEVLAVH